VVGYCGGTTEWPTYNAISDHTEALRVEFDPSKLSYEEVLRIFWEEHTPMPMAFTGTQYRSAIFCHSEDQARCARRLRDEIRPSVSKHTLITDAGNFYRAEEYHQKFLTKQSASWARV